MTDAEYDGPLWVAGDMMLRVAGTATEPDRLIKPRRPFALLGRDPDADIVIDDRAVSTRHAYFHLDRRGVYVVDLVTRTGLRLNGQREMVGWLRPGDQVEVAGRSVELVRVRYQGVVADPPPCTDDLLAETGSASRPSVTLEPRRPRDSPWVLGSELVFLGWSASCGIQIRDSAVARTHCAVVRSAAGAFLVNLCGKQTWVEDRPVRGATPLRDGDLLTLGTTQFTVRVEPPPQTTSDQLPALVSTPVRDTNAPHFRPTADEGWALSPSLPIPAELIPEEARSALMAWMLGTLQGGQGELIRRQGEFQLAVTQVLQQFQRDNAALLNSHLQRIETIGQELGALRAEIERRGGSPARQPPPNVTPLRVARPDPAPDAPDGPTSTAWLLDRVTQLEDENKSAWKDLLGRLSPSRKGS